MSSHASSYRFDIDGLRAIAVICVVLYHLVPEVLPGGFIGVSIFYVISGFLITRTLHRGLTSRHFSARAYIIRRIYRIVPALSVVCLVSTCIAIALMTPGDLIHYAGSLLSSLIFISNIYFWEYTNYFAKDTELWPLLHSWSLSIEMQFYLLWALVMWLWYCYSKSITTLASIILVIIMMSITLSVVVHYIDSTAGFYLLPFRLYELAIGGIVAVLPVAAISYARWMTILYYASLCMVALPIVLPINTHTTLWVHHMLPCVSAAYIIYYGRSRTVPTIMTHAIMVRVGLISYSLYLVHWPIVSFYHYVGLPSMTMLNAITILLISYLLAELLYYSVEQPFRHHQFSKRRILLVPIIVLLSATGIIMYLQDGMPWRISGQHFAKVPTFDKDFGIGDSEYFTVNALGNVKETPAFILVGDSYAGHYMHGFNQLLAQQHLGALGYSIPACFFAEGITTRDEGKFVKNCDTSFATATELASSHEAPLVLAFSWLFYGNNIVNIATGESMFDTYEDAQPFIIKQLARYRQRLGPAHTIIVIGMSPDVTPKDVLSRCLLMPNWLYSGCPNSALITRKLYQKYETYNNVLASTVSDDEHMYFVNPMDALCNDVSCRIIDNNTRYFFDRWHLSRAGSLVAVSHMLPAILKHSSDYTFSVR